jgi:putative ABC transport system permease protein
MTRASPGDPGPPGAPARRAPRRGGRRGPRRLLALARGEAGAGPAWALAGIALLGVFVAMAGPRELATVQTTALQAALARVPGLDDGISSQVQWQVAGHDSVLTPALSNQVTTAIAAQMHPPVRPDLARSWSSVTTPAHAVVHPAPRAVLSGPPALEIAYRSALPAYARLTSGSRPDAVTHVRGDLAVHRAPTTTFQIAATAATAARFGLHIGSVISLGSYPAGTLRLKLTGIIAPVSPGAAFWQADPQLAAPTRPAAAGPPQIWSGGVFIGPAELASLQKLLANDVMQGEWFIPLDLHELTHAQLPKLLASLSALVASDPGSNTRAAALFHLPPAASSGLNGALSAFSSAGQAAAGIESLLIVDEFIAVVILMLVCARLAAEAHRRELTLLRSRGASTAQVARRLLARTAVVTGPGIVLGAALALALRPADDSPQAWLLGALAALVALGSPAVIAAWTYRRTRPAQQRDRVDMTVLRPSRRRSVAEITVLIVAAAAIVALRLRGTGLGTDPYVSAAPVLVAVAAGLIVARLYPVPLRRLLPIASRQSGPVGFLGLARASRSRLGAILPALALVVSLTLAVLGSMVLSSVASGQSAAAWQQVGADVTITESGGGRVSPTAQQAIGAVPGVRHTAAIYTATSQGPFAGALINGGSSQPVGLVVADPAQYAALAQQTPWPDFPAAALARGHGAGIPVLVSPAVAARGLPAGTGGGRSSLGLDIGGIRHPVRVAGTIGDTPAMPAGGRYVVVPAWAAPRFPVLSGPDTLLATGSAIDLPALRAATARYLRGAQVTSRAQVLAGLANSPAQLAAEQLYRAGVWIAVLLSIVAVLVSLAASAGSRTQLIERLTALGMAARQARGVALVELLPLLSVAVLGTLVSAAVLVLAVGPVLNLAVFTGASGQVPVRPDLPMLLPVAGVIVLAIAVVAAQSAALLGRDVAAALRREETG